MFDSSDRDDRTPGGPGADTLSHCYDWTITRPSTAIVELVAIAADREPSSLQPLFDTVDPEALDRLIRLDVDAEGAGGTGEDARTDRSGTAGRPEREVTFEYVGYLVTVRSDGEVTVTSDEPLAGEE